MSSPNAKEQPGLIAYLDAKMGQHSGHFPEYQWYCPFCLDRRGSESDSRKFRFNAVKGQGTCFRCGYGCKSVETLLKSLNGGKLTSQEMDLISGEVNPVQIDRLRDELLIRFYATERINKPRSVYLPPEYVPMKGNGNNFFVRPAFNYLRDVRKFTHGLANFIEKHQVGYCLTGEYANRLIFPVTQGGKQVYFTSRYCGDHFQKGKNPKNTPGRFTKETCLLNYDGCVGAEEVVVVEGPLSMAPFNYPVAMMGKTLSEGQMDLLDLLAEHGTKEFILATDPDASREASEVFRRMSGRLPKVSYLRLEGGDPFDLRENMKAFVNNRRYAVGVADALRGLRVHICRPRMVRH